jgi:GntR family transcriptional regulator
MEAEQELEAGLMSSEESQLLKVPVGSAALFMRRTTYTERDLPIEYAKSIYCGNKYVFFTHMKREQLMP